MEVCHDSHQDNRNAGPDVPGKQDGRHQDGDGDAAAAGGPPAAAQGSAAAAHVRGNPDVVAAGVR